MTRIDLILVACFIASLGCCLYIGNKYGGRGLDRLFILPKGECAGPQTLYIRADLATDQSAKIKRLEAALLEIEEYLEGRADADCDQDGYIPNEEMKLLVIARAALEASIEH